MVAIPDRDFDLEDHERVADWIELWCLLRSEREVSRTDAADVVHNSLLARPDSDEGDLTPQELAMNRIDGAIAVARRRLRDLGGGYPLRIEPDSIGSGGAWDQCLCFTALLLADLGRFYRQVNTDFDPASGFTRLFEKITQHCLQLVLGGTSVRFGWPIEPGWPTGVAERIRRLADEFGLAADSPEEKIGAHDKDIGLDVATRVRFGDEGPATMIVLSQCATGKNFDVKENEPPMGTWESLIRWEAELQRGVAFPWRKDL